MSTRATENELGSLHEELARILKKEIQKEVVDKDGNVVRPAAILNVARQFLKDNNITATVDTKPMRELVDALPSFDDESPVQPGMPLQ